MALESIRTVCFHRRGVFDYYGLFNGCWLIQNCYFFVSPFDYLYLL